MVSAQERNYIYKLLKKVNLVDFLEKDCQIDFKESGNRYCALCPLHGDTAPSFYVFTDEEGVWFYKCFGCNSGGTIIDFCMDKYQLDHPSEALILLAEKLDIKSSKDMIVKAVQEATVNADRNKKMECSHFVASNRLRTLFRKYNNDAHVESFVVMSYRKMNQELDHAYEDPDYQAEAIRVIESISEEAIRKLKDNGYAKA